MDRILSTYSYGICLFSMEVLQDFLKKEKIRSKKLLHKFQKDKKLYLAMQKEGIWFPISKITSTTYATATNWKDMIIHLMTSGNKSLRLKDLI